MEATSTGQLRPTLRSRRPTLRTVLLLVVLGTVVVAGLGLLSEALPEASLMRKVTNLDGELGFPALWSGLLLAANGVLFLLLRRELGVWARVLGVLLLLLAGDEVVLLHERLELAAGVDWQVLYAPVGLLGLVCVLALARPVWRFRPAAMLSVGAGLACYGLSQLLEAVQWRGEVQVPGYVYMMIREEVLEMSGSLLVLVGVLLVRDRSRAEPS